MVNLSGIGRIFYGISVAVMGLLAIYYHDFPYMLLPPKHEGIPGLAILAYISGAMLVLAGASIVSGTKTRTVALVTGSILLLIFCFYFIPYEFIASADYMHFSDWENAAKELALASGAFVVAACFPEKNETSLTRFLNKLVFFSPVVFSITIISFSIDHFLYAHEASDYVPAWVPWHLFWLYFTGLALFGSGIAIIFKIRPGLIAALLGAMIFSWFIMLHLPRVIASPAADMGSEIASACLALAYCGTAFVIAGQNAKGS
jgi:uncharacterized membrane protein YphA (DoxX/SURF4 family)